MDSMEDSDAAISTSSVRLVIPKSEPQNHGINKCAKLWKRALRKLQSIDLDPWLDFPTHAVPVFTVTRHRYSAIKKKWVVDEIIVKLESTPFDRGAMRECFRLKKLSNSGSPSADWHHATNYVAKRYINKVERHVYFDDVRLQMEAKLWGEAFNRQNPPKKVDIFQLSIIEMRPNNSAANSDSDVQLYHIERFMEGEYRKYNSNSGFVDENLRNTPQAFSHFTFERSGHRLLVVDIQGVGDLYTDPQIHTSDGVGYSDGNLGPKGMAYFFHSHRCNPLCEYLGLTSFDLAPSELADSLAFIPETADPSEQHSGPEGASNVENKVVNIGSNHTPLKQNNRRRSVSLSQPSSANCRFGPTVARSTESVHSGASLILCPRRRVDSLSVFSDGFPSNLSDDLALDKFPSMNMLDEDPLNTLAVLKLDAGMASSDNPDKTPLHVKLHLPLNTPPVTPTTEVYPKPLFAAETLGKVRSTRTRVASGDSGYSGRIHFKSPTSSYDPHSNYFARSLSTDPFGDVFNGSLSSLLGSSLPTSPCPIGASLFGHNTLHTSDDEAIFPSSLNHQNSMDWFPNPTGRFLGPFGMPKRRRNLSESSDLDVEEDRRMAGNLLHQLMHEGHRPSCATHPTNLDQEIGQSVLGQIHHELARLHEAGKFLPTCKGGWSHAGLGGHFDRSSDSSNENKPCNNSTPMREQQIDWGAVLFHERHAAQLGCLEAMIVMAHYHLGLPTQLLFDCPIKPVKNDLRSGVDYLWRAAEGGDRRCMILLARYLDVAATISDSSANATQPAHDPRDFLFLPMLQSVNSDTLPSVSPDSWAEAVVWYEKAVDSACATPNGPIDEGLDAEGGYDAAEDLLPVYRILGRMAEMYSVGGFGLDQDFNRAGDLYSRAGELALAALQGRLATKYFDLGEEAYSNVQ